MGLGASSLDKARNTAEGFVGRIAVQGRYHKLPRRLEEDYAVEKKALGTGYSGAVLLARNNATGMKYAVKAFKLHGVSKEKKKELASEAEIFLSMDHPHVARLVDVYESQDELSLVMECMEGGELFDRVTLKKVFSEKDAVQASWQMLLAVNYIHSCGVVHRDLKLENFLYENQDSDFLKLIDFGFSKIWDKNTKMELSCGTLSYVAPEVLAKSYTSQCDMWSLGVIVFILLAGYMPFGGHSERQQIAAIKSGKIDLRKERWKNVSEIGFDFVSKLLVVDPDRRLTAEQALNHSWILSRVNANTGGSSVDQSMADAFCNFARQSLFRRACMQLTAWSLTAEERAEVRDAFLELDKGKTGVINLSELQQVLQAKFHIPEDESLMVFEALDNNHDETVNYSEFLAAMVSSRLQLHDNLLKATFRRFDTDNSGYITLEDLQQVLGKDFKADDAMRELDRNKDGKIEYDEFLAYLRHSSAQDFHLEAAHAAIDREISRHETDLSSEGEKSPARVRKRDKLLGLGLRLVQQLSPAPES